MFGGKSLSTIKCGPIQVFSPTFTPGINRDLIPVFTLSPKYCAEFSSARVNQLVFNHHFDYAVVQPKICRIVPAPKLHYSPKMLSPT